MKKLHIIHAKSIEETPLKTRGKLLPTLETEVLDWAKGLKKDAYKATLEIQQELAKNPSNTLQNKYFKYLRRLLELKLEDIENKTYKTGEETPVLKKNLSDFLNIESVRVPEHLSCSAISMYEFCPRKWYFSYALGIKCPPTAALHFGSAVDDALNFYYEEKIKTGLLVPRTSVHAQFFERFAKGYDNVIWGNDDPKWLQQNGPKILDKYLDSFDRITNAIDVQTEVRIPFDGGFLLGYIDILEPEAIVDTKTASKFWETKGPFAKANGELQPKAYSLWFLEKYERLPREFRYQIVTKHADENGNAVPETQLIYVEIKKFELESFRNRIQKVWDEIMSRLPKGKKAFPAQAEIGSENGRGLGKKLPGVLCCHQYCDYAKYCEADGLAVPLRWQSKTKDKTGYHVYADGTEV